MNSVRASSAMPLRRLQRWGAQGWSAVCLVAACDLAKGAAGQGGEAPVPHISAAPQPPSTSPSWLRHHDLNLRSARLVVVIQEAVDVACSQGGRNLSVPGVNHGLSSVGGRRLVSAVGGSAAGGRQRASPAMPPPCAPVPWLSGKSGSNRMKVHSARAETYVWGHDDGVGPQAC
jgi:hypothetical protein